MPRNKAPVSELGAIYAHGAEFRAHVQFRADDGEQKNIYGPSRATEDEAQKDLRQIRAAGGVGSTREESLKIMMAEARRIKMSAEPASRQPAANYTKHSNQTSNQLLKHSFRAFLKFPLGL